MFEELPGPPLPDDAPAPDLLACAEELRQKLLAAQRLALAEAGADPRVLGELSLSLSWHSEMSARELATELAEQARLASDRVSPERAGHVYCFGCGSAACGHARPVAEGEVFAGYTNQGVPVWQEFANNLQALGDRRVGQLFGDKPPLLTRVVGRKALIAEQMVAFGRNSMTYRIVGQMVAGYLRLGPRRFALTVQAYETPERHLRSQFVLAPELQEALAEAPPRNESHFHRVQRALQDFRRHVESLDLSWRSSPTKPERKALEDKLFAAFRELGAGLERKGRQQQRRTVHAQQRAEQQRPVHKAWDDLGAADDEALFRDNKTQSHIVLGRRGRLHVFNDDGRHVTSLVIGHEQLERRIQRGRYSRLDAEGAKLLRAAVSKHFAVTDES